MQSQLPSPLRPLSVGLSCKNLGSLWQQVQGPRLLPTRRFSADLCRCMASTSGREATEAKAWEFFRSIGSPQFHVAPMVDQSELAFRMLCRRHGATAAYTPMLHSRLFSESEAYREEHFTTCPADRPLFTQFCSNDPEHLLAAARFVEDKCDAIDINLGCPQRIARRGHYGAFLMEDWDLIARMVRMLADNLSIPVTCKIRVFTDLQKTLDYARMIEAAGASLIAVHGRTREQKQADKVRANWDYIKAVKEAVKVPVLANGNIRHLQDVRDCMAYTGVDGVMSAESLLDDPALFLDKRLQYESTPPHLAGCKLLLEYLELTDEFTTPGRMMCGHAFKMLGPWLSEHTDLRDTLANTPATTSGLRDLTLELQSRIVACGRTTPVAKVSERAKARMEREAAVEKSIAEQLRERRAFEALQATVPMQEVQLTA